MFVISSFFVFVYIYRISLHKIFIGYAWNVQYSKCCSKRENKVRHNSRAVEEKEEKKWTNARAKFRRKSHNSLSVTQNHFSYHIVLCADCWVFMWFPNAKDVKRVFVLSYAIVSCEEIVWRCVVSSPMHCCLSFQKNIFLFLFLLNMNIVRSFFVYILLKREILCIQTPDAIFFIFKIWFPF